MNKRQIKKSLLKFLKYNGTDMSLIRYTPYEYIMLTLFQFDKYVRLYKKYQKLGL